MSGPEKGLNQKLYVVIGMSALILALLIYLIASGGTSKLQNGVADAQASASASASASVSAQPSSSPSASASASAAPTSTPAVTIDTKTDTSLQRIVSKSQPIDSSYVPSNLTEPNVESNGTQTLRTEASSAIEQMFTAAKSDGIDLYLNSGYRSYTEQVSLYYYYCDEYGEDYTTSIDANPGASEHQLGLAADIGTVDHACELNSCFGSSEAYTWLSAHAAEYGFIQRYTEGTESITGIINHPWHYRYVGKEEAEKIKASGKTMEEYYAG